MERKKLWLISKGERGAAAAAARATENKAREEMTDRKTKDKDN